jgi:NAD(P)-dependent dehydrogenase (short-subunit alcohol dehydrogenase family)
VSASGALGGRHAVVTGAGSGMGRATALRLARSGASVSLLDRDPDALKETGRLLDPIGSAHTAAVCDVTDPAQVDEAFNAFEAMFGPVYALAAAAGILGAAFALDEDAYDIHRKVMAVNVDGVFLTNRRAGHSMAGSGQGGRIVNWSSQAARQGARAHSAYSASKAAVEGLTRVLAVEWASYGIGVNAIALGPVATPMIGMTPEADRSRPDIPLGRMADPDEVAGLAQFLLSDDARYLTGAVIYFDGGMEAGRGTWDEAAARARLARLHQR